MPGRPPKVDQMLMEFLRALSSAENLYEQVQKVATVRATASHPRLHVKQVRRVVELAFMGLIAAWEDFLEGTLVRYVAGAKTKSGFKPNLRVGAAKSIEHAYQLVTGDPDHDSSKHYVSWNDPNAIGKLAKVLFEAGRPFAGNLDGTHCQSLKDAVKLRNRVAHSSEKCREDFKEVARRFNGLAKGGKLSQSYRVGDLLLSKAVRCFGDRARDKGWTIFEAYCEMYKELAKRIVP
jgi:hypothetical protein